MGGGCSVTVSLVLSVLSEDVGVVFPFEASMLNGYASGKRIRVNCKRGMVP